MMYIDTHCHLDAIGLTNHIEDVIKEAKNVGVHQVVIPAVSPKNFDSVIKLGQRYGAYALGIHPLYVPHLDESALDVLREAVEMAIHDPCFVGIGEIGLDYFLPEFKIQAMRDKQMHFYLTQLAIAQMFDLPVLLHIRRAVDMILKGLRQIRVKGGIAHAFNGSLPQAHRFIQLGFKLGFGGEMTYVRSDRIRRLAQVLPLESIVLETDSPDMAPSWLTDETNTPIELPRIAVTLSELRNIPLLDVSRETTLNAYQVLPRLTKHA